MLQRGVDKPAPLRALALRDLGWRRAMAPLVFGLIALATFRGHAQQAAPPPATLAEFEPTWASLAAGYACPEWFRDAKFGVWAHWGPQCVPEQGDWYARNMYVQGSRQYRAHVDRWGHPADAGFMAVCRDWHAEHWDPHALLDRYVRAGARYFVAMANHCDNFDNYDSKHHGWNSVRIGPHRDVVGEWAAAARARGLRFGVSNHSAHAWHWLQTAYGYDPEGPRAGQRYDAGRLTAADGAGQWWDGLDPQQLYCGPTLKMPDGLPSIAAVKAWHAAQTLPWTEAAPAGNPQFVSQWKLRCLDVIDSYRPDFVYFDNTGLPLQQAGLDVTAHFYNASRRWHDGRLEAVVTAKNLSPEQRQGIVEDVERGARPGIEPWPWQTCTCLGGWHYQRDVPYKSAQQVIQLLVDVVSKNGNLLLSVPLRGDGTLDEREIAILDELAAWMAIHGEGIYGTRPWTVFGEGPTRVVAGTANELQATLTSRDLRFTARDRYLYAYFLGWPEDGEVTMTSLAAWRTVREIADVTLLGSGEAISWTRDDAGVHVRLPVTPTSPWAGCLRVEWR